MPADFDLKQHGLDKFKVATYNGLVFASLDADSPPLADYFGPEVMPWLNRIFDGRKPVNHGTSRQRSDEHTSELESLMRTSYAVLRVTKIQINTDTQRTTSQLISA